MREETLQLARLLNLAAEEGSIPSRETLRKAAETIVELQDLVEVLSDDLLGDDCDVDGLD